MPTADKKRSRATIGAQFAARRTLYAAVGRVAPRAMGKRAAALYCQLPANAGRRKDAREFPGTTAWVTTASGARIATESWGEGPTVYLTHGWGGWRGQLGAFVAPLVDAGFRVVGFDSLSHGESDPGIWGPRHSTGDEMASSLAAVLDHYGPAAGIVAHSMGCITTVLTAHEGAPVDRMVLIACAPDLAKAADHYARLIKLPESGLAPMHEEIMRRAGQRRWEDFDVPHLVAAGTMPPSLMIHDTQDKESPYKYAARLAAGWPEVDFVTTEGLGHQRILMNSDVIARSVAHLATKRASLPN